MSEAEQGKPSEVPSQASGERSGPPGERSRPSGGSRPGRPPSSRSRGGGRRGRGRFRGGRRKRKRPCAFCVDPRANVIDYKNINMLRGYMDERGRIKKARQTGTCRKHERKLARAIKRTRELALLPYTLD